MAHGRKDRVPFGVVNDAVVKKHIPLFKLDDFPIQPLRQP